jgi:hypothetical protein
MPVALTIAVDNGPLSVDALAHYRTGLTGLVHALPADMEVTLDARNPKHDSIRIEPADSVAKTAAL